MTRIDSKNANSSVTAYLRRFITKVGRDFVHRAFLLVHALNSPRCSFTDAAIIVGALAYLVSPFDAIPDIFVPLGFTDDAAVLAAAVAKLSDLIDDDVRAKAQGSVNDLFGKSAYA